MNAPTLADVAAIVHSDDAALVAAIAHALTCNTALTIEPLDHGSRRVILKQDDRTGIEPWAHIRLSRSGRIIRAHITGIGFEGHLESTVVTTADEAARHIRTWFSR